jgi:uncharacterized protein YfdQ (DUF2303 family)
VSESNYSGSVGGTVPAESEDHNDTQAAVAAGMALARPQVIDGRAVDSPHVAVVPAGARAEVLDLERFAFAPRRPHGNYKAATVDAFVKFVERHASDDDTTVWVHPTDGTIRAVLNDHARGGDQARWRDFVADLELRETEEWRHWLKRDGTLGGQEEFAEHIEEGITEIARPEGATLMEIAQTFHATTSANFRQATRLRDGRVQMRYDEEVQAAAGQSGELAVPDEIVLLLAPYVGEEAVEITARLRYRLGGGKLRIGYKLDRPERVKREALESIASQIGDAFGDRVFLGAPPA